MFKINRDAFKHDIKITMPRDNSNNLNTIIGHDLLKPQFEQYVKKLMNDPSASSVLHNKIIFIGATGTGKVTTAYSVAGEAKVPIIEIEGNALIEKKERKKKLKHLFSLVSKHSNAVLLLKNFDYLGNLEEEEEEYSICKELLNYIEYLNNLIITTFSSDYNFPDFMLRDNGFTHTILFEEPTLNDRELFFKKYAKVFPLNQDIDFAKLARSTTGLVGEEILHITRNAAILASQNSHDCITDSDFDEAISNQELGQKMRTMTENERISAAYHEAGHVIASYYSDPQNYKLSKVEIIHRTDSLGITKSQSDEEQHTIFKEQLEYLICGCLGGYVAEKLVYGSTTTGVVADLAMASAYAKNMVCNLGMSADFGVAMLTNDILVSPEMLNIAGREFQKILAKQLSETEFLISSHRASLEALKYALLKKETIFGEEILDIFKMAEPEYFQNMT